MTQLLTTIQQQVRVMSKEATDLGTVDHTSKRIKLMAIGANAEAVINEIQYLLKWGEDDKPS